MVAILFLPHKAVGNAGAEKCEMIVGDLALGQHLFTPAFRANFQLPRFAQDVASQPSGDAAPIYPVSRRVRRIHASAVARLRTKPSQKAIPKKS
jgi:hypothetical protein